MRLRRLLSTVRLRLRSVLRRARVEQELDDEIRDHIGRRVAANPQSGAATYVTGNYFQVLGLRRLSAPASRLP